MSVQRKLYSDPKELQNCNFFIEKKMFKYFFFGIFKYINEYFCIIRNDLLKITSLFF